MLPIIKTKVFFRLCTNEPTFVYRCTHLKQDRQRKGRAGAGTVSVQGGAEVLRCKQKLVAATVLERFSCWLLPSFVEERMFPLALSFAWRWYQSPLLLTNCTKAPSYSWAQVYVYIYVWGTTTEKVINVDRLTQIMLHLVVFITWLIWKQQHGTATPTNACVLDCSTAPAVLC